MYRFHARQIGVILDRFAATSAPIGATLSRAITPSELLHVRALSLTRANNARYVQLIETDDADAPRYLPPPSDSDGTPVDEVEVSPEIFRYRKII